MVVIHHLSQTIADRYQKEGQFTIPPALLQLDFSGGIIKLFSYLDLSEYHSLVQTCLTIGMPPREAPSSMKMSGFSPPKCGVSIPDVVVSPSNDAIGSVGTPAYFQNRRP
jgi:hypothetical protein